MKVNKLNKLKMWLHCLLNFHKHTMICSNNNDMYCLNCTFGQEE